MKSPSLGQSTSTFCAPAGIQDAMKSSEAWLRDYETAKQLADDTLAMIQVMLTVYCPPHSLCLLLWPLVTSSYVFIIPLLILPWQGRSQKLMMLRTVPGKEYQIPTRGSGGLSCDSRRSKEAGLTGGAHREHARRCGVSLLRQHVRSCCLTCTAAGSTSLPQRMLPASQCTVYLQQPPEYTQPAS